MSFDKRDYFYDKFKIESDVDDSSESDNELGNQRSNFRDRIPREWVQNLMFELQEISKSKGVELLDRCSSYNFANFVGRLNGKKVWRD